MQFESFSAFLAMGGYGFYVWWSFGLCFALTGILYWDSKVRHRKTVEAIRSKILREQKLKKVAQQQNQI